MNIIFDLDGTLIDSSERMYRLFQRLIAESIFTKEEYWSLKRNKVNHRIILEKYFPNYDFDTFEKAWLSMIELPEYLEMDKNYPDTIDVLNFLKSENNIILLTARQSKKELYSELERLNIINYFDLILVTETRYSKEKLLERFEKEGITREKADFFVSDMGNDIAFANKREYHKVGITHGFMNHEHLKEYNPRYIIDELKELKTLIAI